MHIIKLPSTLPNDLDYLKNINQQLQAGTGKLDWSGVISAPKSVLEILLADIDADSEVLNLDNEGIADHIIDAVNDYFLYLQISKSDREEINIEDNIVGNNVNNNVNNIETSQDSIKDKQEIAVNIPLLNKPSPVEIRWELEKMIVKDLLGPVNGEKEEINERKVSDRYLVGVLAPRFRNKDPEEEAEQQDNLTISSKGNIEEGNTEDNIAASNTMIPSSIGMSFCVNGAAKSLEITAKWGKYEWEQSEIIVSNNGEPKKVWQRYPIEGKCTQEIVDGKKFTWVVDNNNAPEVQVTGNFHRMDNQDWIVSIFLTNNQKEPDKKRDKAWLFQPELIVRSGNKNHTDIFRKKPIANIIQKLQPLIQAENEAMAMLYRNQVEFAVGHGVSVAAKTSPEKITATEIKTTFIPTFEVPQTTPPEITEIPELSGLILDMKLLGEAESNNIDLITTLNHLPKAYQTWIQQQENRLCDPTVNLTNHQNAAQTAIKKCKTTLTRIQEGINTLQSDKNAREAFKFMNNAMYQQRIHSIYAEKIRRGEKADLNKIDIAKNRSWRPFQLAFILLNIPSITNLHHSDRSHPSEAICDLLWFPTGGGKTEAYLGLTAYTLGLRRLQGIIGNRDGNNGVAVLMRYTLRLLTLQQFQRATTLICACEFIRRQNEEKWGKEVFRIGLWVGQNSTPNYTSQSEEFVKQKRGQSYSSGIGSPHQLTNCPWCGCKIEANKNISVDPVDKGAGRTYIKCGDLLGKCLFAKGEGLPIIVVDEEIYRRLPSLLIATVDKFAQMPWKGEIQMLFGQINGYCERHGFRSPDIDDKDHHKKTNKLPTAKTIPHRKLRPPDLIIQDELHLISGPLGSLVGLYETAVDELASWELDGQKIRPKVIASTATIRQASTQVHNLFLRKLQVFPPQGLDIEDNFFSLQRTPSPEFPGRRYIGICAPGKRLKAALIRVYLAILAASQSLYEKYGKEVDPWMTLVGYFNSLRELGGTRRLVEDDIRTRLLQMDKRGLAKRNINKLEELTSRKDSTEIPIILDTLEIPFIPAPTAENKTEKTANQKLEKPVPLDVILATNMISVGVDIKRLGAMVVCGQPKNTAEYIQATSRVGRSYPGLVITLYNWARPRDLSHYERFAYYHATFYQNVEALSITPFASGALYRGLSALLVSLVRLAGETYNGNDTAGSIDYNHHYIQAAIKTIIKRAGLIVNTNVGNYVEEELEIKIHKWLNNSENRTGGRVLKYQIKKRDDTSINLLQNATGGKWEDFTCLNSLRNVEATIGLILNQEPPDDELDRLPQPYQISQ